MKLCFPALLAFLALGTLLMGGTARAASRAQDEDNEVIELKAFYDAGAEREGNAFAFPHLAADAKKSWPELVGKHFEQAKSVIEREAPDVRVYRVPVSSAVTTDYSPQRVRVFVSDDGKDVVELTPTRG